MSAWPHWFISVYVLLVGAVVGSFLNVVIYRLPRRRSVVRPRSFCPQCGRQVRWFDNVPVLSWLALRGRCRDCRTPIPIRYPVVEALAGLAAFGAFQLHGPTVAALETALFAWVSLALAWIDLDHQILPDVITYPSIVLGLGASFIGGLTSPLESLLGVLVGAGIPTAVILGYRLIRGVEGMGWGDVKYLAAIGAVVGVYGCVWVLLIGAVLGAVVGVGLMISGRGTGKTALPFGTFLAVAVLIWLYVPVSVWSSVGL